MQIMAWDIVNEEPPQNLKLQKYNRTQNITNSNPNWLVWALILIAAGGWCLSCNGLVKFLIPKIYLLKVYDYLYLHGNFSN